MSKRLYLVRHCESSGQDSDAPLTARGFAQAEELGSFFDGLGVECLVSSSYTRAHQSMMPLSSRLGLNIRLDSRLVERKLSGEPMANWREAIRSSFDDPDLSFPGGESCRTVTARGRAAIDHILAQPQQVSVVATHGNMMTLILRSFDPSFGFSTWETLSNPDVFSLVKRGKEIVISRVWDTGTN
jgi:2,3-bisphosphoglycerate-dependent phosphoglycerate mutase